MTYVKFHLLILKSNWKRSEKRERGFININIHLLNVYTWVRCSIIICMLCAYACECECAWFSLLFFWHLGVGFSVTRALDSFVVSVWNGDRLSPSERPKVHDACSIWLDAMLMLMFVPIVFRMVNPKYITRRSNGYFSGTSYSRVCSLTPRKLERMRLRSFG